MSIVRILLAGLAAGFVAGGLVGLGEGVAIWSSNPATAASTPLYGTLFYGCLLAIFGPATSLGFWILAKILKKSDQFEERTAFILSTITLLVPTALVVARFRVVRDLFNERLPIASGTGIAVHIGLLLFGAALAAGVYFLTRDRGPLKKYSWPIIAIASFAILTCVSLPFFALSPSSEAKLDEVTAEDSKPPVILIMVDTLRADHLSSYGHSSDTTPNLTKLAQDGVQFNNNFAQASWTRPSVASILTSLPPSSHKTMYKNDRLPDATFSIGEAFDKAGYRTGGMVTNYNIAPYFNFHQGFDDYSYLEPDFYFWANEGSSRLSLYQLVRIVREKVAPAKDQPSYYYQDAQVTTDRAISWIDKHKEKPFFLFLTYMDPHDPYFARPLKGEAYSRAETVNPDTKLRERFLEIYDQEIQFFDTHFARLIADLKAKGLYDKAIIAVTSDHGEEFQEHGGWWHGTTLYDEQTHVPLIIKLPKQKHANTIRTELTELIDITPTLSAAAEIKGDASWRGRDLFSKEKPPNAVYSENDHQGNDLRALRSAEWKIIEANENNPRGLQPFELYKIDEDPDEKTDRAKKDKDALTKMLSSLKNARENAGKTDIKRDTHELDEDSQKRLKDLGYAD